MDLALRQQDIDFLPEYINSCELKEFVQVIEKHMSNTSLGDLILSACVKAKKGLRPTNELKDKMNSFVRSFPEELLAKEGLKAEANSETDYNNHLIEHDSIIAKKNMFKGPTNDEIYELWKKKRKDRKLKQDRITNGSVCLKRKGLPIDLVSEHIIKKMK
jgi:hypothetical protein